MAAKALPSPEVLRQLLHYEPETGKLFWKERGLEWFADGVHGKEHNAAKWNAKHVGKEALTTQLPKGYLYGGVLGEKCLAHRVALAISYGMWPTDDVDHVNMDRSDNRLDNLRVSSRAENMWNRTAQTNNTSGFKGVTWDKRKAKWLAQISVEGRHIFLGYFASPAEAHTAYSAAAKRLHGDFARAH